jgi:hypothetical protein
LFVIIVGEGCSCGKLRHITLGAHQGGNRSGAALGVSGVAAGQRLARVNERSLQRRDLRPSWVLFCVLLS